ncbi:MAG: hypothetical protein H0V62_13145 [Gammaproteobacteria bacterium]|nr:hypothetical protein [Gammaproteobacteria bacterium]
MHSLPDISKLKLVAIGVALAAAWALPASAEITIANEDTANPSLLYQGEPMFKIGPMPETTVFGMQWGSKYLDHQAWFDWMAANELGYGRVYPDSGYGWLPTRAPGRVYPFEVVRWEGDKPIVDITRFDPDYWDNMSRVIGEAKERGVVLQMQLYQRVFFEDVEDGEGWPINYFNPVNNVNKFEVPAEGSDGGIVDTVKDTVKGLIGASEPIEDGYGLFAVMAEDTPWREVHRQWVEHILNAIGDHGNVIIDLMNEGNFNKGMTEGWIETTLDIIEKWEKKTGNDLRVGMDFDHLYKIFLKTGDRAHLEYVLSNPRLDVIIAEGSESHVVPELVAGDREPMHKDLAREFRARYQKPVISTNSPSRGPHVKVEALHLYQWYSLMTKLQGVGVYAKEYPLAFTKPPVSIYATRSKILMRFFDQIDDYAALELLPGQRISAPGEYKLALTSPGEAVVYLSAGISAAPIAKDEEAELKLTELDVPDGAVKIESLNPRSGETQSSAGTIQHGVLVIKLPNIDHDVAMHITPAKQ